MQACEHSRHILRSPDIIGSARLLNSRGVVEGRKKSWQSHDPYE